MHLGGLDRLNFSYAKEAISIYINTQLLAVIVVSQCLFDALLGSRNEKELGWQD